MLILGATRAAARSMALRIWPPVRRCRARAGGGSCGPAIGAEFFGSRKRTSAYSVIGRQPSAALGTELESDRNFAPALLVGADHRVTFRLLSWKVNLGTQTFRVPVRANRTLVLFENQIIMLVSDVPLIARYGHFGNLLHNVAVQKHFKKGNSPNSTCIPSAWLSEMVAQIQNHPLLGQPDLPVRCRTTTRPSTLSSWPPPGRCSRAKGQ